MVEPEGIEPSFSPCKGLVLPLDDDPMVGRDGVEPPEPEGNRFTVCPAPTYGISPHILLKTYRVFQFAYWTYRNSSRAKL